MADRLTQQKWERLVGNAERLARRDRSSAEDAVQAAVVRYLTDGHELEEDTRLLWAYVRTQIHRNREADQLEHRKLAQYMRDQATNGGEVLFLPTSRCRRKATWRKEGVGRGYLLGLVPCVVCGGEFKPVKKSSTRRRQETCDKSCAAKLRWQRKKEAA